MIRTGLNILTNYAKNICTDAELNYVVESRDWSVYEDGRAITNALKPRLKSRTTRTSAGLMNSIIHFGSQHVYRPVRKTNKTVLSVFHLIPESYQNGLRETVNSVDIVHTTNDITRTQLIHLGISPEKIVKIPLGIDLNRFRPVSDIGKELFRYDLGIPSSAKVIGSFQKDGAGWGEGMIPKYAKDPDTLIKTLVEINEQSTNPIFVLLLGAARGYVKAGLRKHGIQFKHIYLKDFNEVPKYYNALDLYLQTSRAEGMPKAIFESMASGVPIVSTNVGIAPEVIDIGHNGYMAGIGNVERLCEFSLGVLENKRLSDYLVKCGLETVKNYSWDVTANRYYNEIYLRLL